MIIRRPPVEELVDENDATELYPDASDRPDATRERSVGSCSVSVVGVFGSVNVELKGVIG